MIKISDIKEEIAQLTRRVNEIEVVVHNNPNAELDVTMADVDTMASLDFDKTTNNPALVLGKTTSAEETSNLQKNVFPIEQQHEKEQQKKVAGNFFF